MKEQPCVVSVYVFLQEMNSLDNNKSEQAWDFKTLEAEALEGVAEHCTAWASNQTSERCCLVAFEVF